MNKILLISLLSTLCGFPYLHAQNNTSGHGKEDRPIKFSKTPNNDRPKAPERNLIEAYYSNGELTIEFLYPEGECDITVTEPSTGFTITDTFDTEFPYTVYIGETSEATITLVTENGHTYSGEITD